MTIGKVEIALVFTVAALAFNGCLSVIRLPCEDVRFTKYSDDGRCTNRVWSTFISQARRKGNKELDCLYPTIKMRYIATKQIYFNDKYYLDNDGNQLKGQKLYERK